MPLDEGRSGPASCDRSRLFDYFVAVSQTPSFLEETGSDGEDNADLIKQCFWEPHLLDRYPLEDDTLSPLPDRDTLSQFLLPNCEQPIPLKVPPAQAACPTHAHTHTPIHARTHAPTHARTHASSHPEHHHRRHRRHTSSPGHGQAAGAASVLRHRADRR